MDFFAIDTPARLRAAASLALENHRRLRQAQPWLPERKASDLEAGLGWVAAHGDLLGLGQPDSPRGFLGGFPVPDFRNAGPGVFCPDFAHATAPSEDPLEVLSLLYRERAGGWAAQGLRLHSVALYATEERALEAFSLLAFGRITLDASVRVQDLAADLPQGTPGDLQVRRADAQDAVDLEALNARLAAHIGAPPVFMPRTRGQTAAQWERWLQAPGHAAWILHDPSGPVGYLKGGPPEDDVSRAVHGPSTLAFSGLWVEPRVRRAGGATALLAAAARHALQTSCTLASVDCETHNLEAFAFWTRRFRPLTWGLERRI